MSDDKAKCKFCLRPITKAVLRAKYQRKVDNARASAAKAKANGNHGGRKKIRDDEQIKNLRAKGLSMRAIAKVIGMSTATVQKGLKS